MKPAWSIIAFTVLSGFGLGLAFVLALGEHWALSADVGATAIAKMALLSGVLTASGLCSSVLHLANPKNAWRALFRVRTSWLSREGVLALLFFPALFWWVAQSWYTMHIYGASPSDGWDNDQAMSALVMALSLGVVFCTAMIYASLRPVRLWRCWLTPVNYLLLSFFSGWILFAAGAGLDSGRVPAFAAWGMLGSGLLSALGKYSHFRRADSEGGLTAGAATGLGAANVRLLELGHGGENFLTREFVYRADRGKVAAARRMVWALAFGVPLLSGLCVLTWPASHWILLFAALSALVGLLAERWLFFAEARHAVRLYHGESRV